MLRRALPSLFCAFALAAPAYSQDVFVPRELKAQAAHPPKEHKSEAKPEKSKEVVRKAEAVTDDNVPTIKVEKPAVTTASKEKKEKAAPTKDKADVEVPTIKIEKVAASKEKSDKPVAKAETTKPEPAKEKTEKAVAKTEPSKQKSDKAVAKADPAKPESTKEKSDKPVAKTETTKPDATKEKSDKAVAKTESAKPVTTKEKSEKSVAKAETTKPEPAKEKSDKPSKDNPVAKSDKNKEKSVAKSDGAKVEAVTSKAEKPVVDDHPATVAASKTLGADKSPEKKISKAESTKPDVVVAKTEKPAAVKDKGKTPAAKPSKSEAFIAKNEPPPVGEGPGKSDIVSVPSQKDQSQIMPAMSTSLEMGFTKLADGFDFPVGKPDAEGYYKARGFRPGGHVGEDWDGVRGGDTDLGDPIYCAGDGIVVFSRDVHLGWGNVIIVRHAYREGGTVKYVDSLYGHLLKMMVSRGQRVSRGQQIATMGTAHGQYDAHLHFEMRKNLEIGMSRSKFQKDFSNYWDPTQFINSHRHLSGGGANYKVAMNTFTHDWMFHFDKNRDFSRHGRSTGESSAALRRALTSKN